MVNQVFHSLNILFFNPLTNVMSDYIHPMIVYKGFYGRYSSDELKQN